VGLAGCQGNQPALCSSAVCFACGECYCGGHCPGRSAARSRGGDLSAKSLHSHMATTAGCCSSYWVADCLLVRQRRICGSGSFLRPFTNGPMEGSVHGMTVANNLLRDLGGPSGQCGTPLQLLANLPSLSSFDSQTDRPTTQPTSSAYSAAH